MLLSCGRSGRVLGKLGWSLNQRRFVHSTTRAHVWDETKDVVVVGSGGAGLLCGIMAADNKLSSVILEKQPLWGGTTSYSGGGLWIPCNFLFPEDTYEQARKYMDLTIKQDSPSSTPARRDTYVRESSKMMSFLRDKGFGWQRATTYPDYYPELYGGQFGRTVEGLPFDSNKIGKDMETLASSVFKQDATDKWLLSTLDTQMISYVATMTLSLKSFSEMAKRFAQSIFWRILGRAPVSMGRSLIVQLRYILNQANDLAPDIRLNSPLEDLVISTDEKTGKQRIEGVIYKDNTGKTRSIKAEKAVFLTCGGFARNKSFRDLYQPGVGVNWTMTSPGDTGDGIQIGMKHGAAIDSMKNGWWCITTPIPRGIAPEDNSFVMYERSLPGNIMVGPSGKRFGNEAENYTAIGQKMLDGKHFPGWMIFDANHRSRYPMGLVQPGKEIPKIFYDEKIVVKADSLTELAEKCGINKEGLENTISTWNQACTNGKDSEWKRGDSKYDHFFGDRTLGSNPNIGAIQKAPFYALRVHPGDLGTSGGLLTDELARVLVKKGEGYQPIEGLYASGNVTASVMAGSYPGAGATLGPALTFAYVGMNHVVSK